MSSRQLQQSTANRVIVLNVRALQLWIPVVAYMAAIFYLSSLSQAPLPSGVSDKPAHALGYLGFGFVIARAIGGGLPPRLTLTGLAVGLAIAVAYGASDEWHQWFVPGRSADLADLYADATGSAIALIASWAWGILALRSRLPAASSRL